MGSRTRGLCCRCWACLQETGGPCRAHWRGYTPVRLDGAQVPGGSRAGGPGVVVKPWCVWGGACLVVGGRAPRGSAQPPALEGFLGRSSCCLGLRALSGLPSENKASCRNSGRFLEPGALPCPAPTPLAPTPSPPRGPVPSSGRGGRHQHVRRGTWASLGFHSCSNAHSPLPFRPQKCWPRTRARAGEGSFLAWRTETPRLLQPEGFLPEKAQQPLLSVPLASLRREPPPAPCSAPSCRPSPPGRLARGAGVSGVRSSPRASMRSLGQAAGPVLSPAGSRHLQFLWGRCRDCKQPAW